jgi:hypothetical protein
VTPGFSGLSICASGTTNMLPCVLWVRRNNGCWVPKGDAFWLLVDLVFLRNS